MRSVGPKGRGLDGPGNLAEGCYRDGKDRLNHFRIAMGSAAEAVAALDLTQIEDGERLQQNLRRVVAMLCKLR